jgi:hypothetical protein
VQCERRLSTNCRTFSTDRGRLMKWHWSNARRIGHRATSDASAKLRANFGGRLGKARGVADVAAAEGRSR